jgi:RHS repeat-associated protein
VDVINEAPQIPQGMQEIFTIGQAGLISSDNSVPKAFINYLFFDQDNEFKKGGFKQVSEQALGSFETLSLDYVPEEEGTMMIYTSNQTAEPLDVFMDDMMVLHTEGPIVRVNDYYPFGMTYRSSERSGFVTNKFLYNEKELQTDLDLDWYDYGARMYDATLGRFHVIDRFGEKYYDFTSFQYGANNPIKYIDVNGDSILLRHQGENIMYKNGGHYWAGTNKSYDGKALIKKGIKAGNLKGFVGKTLNALNDIKSGGSVGADLISNLENNSAYTTIRKGKNGALGTSVDWSPSNTSGGLDVNGGTSRPSFIGLAHELAHSWDLISDGKVNQNTWYTENGKQIPFAEQYALHVENQIRSENGISLRTHYGKRIDYSTNSVSGSGRVLLPGSSNVSLLYKSTLHVPKAGVKLRVPFIYGINSGL